MNAQRHDIENLQHLGSQATVYPMTYTPSILERINARQFNTKAARDVSTVVLDCPEFTSLCPKTGQPDFAHITIEYRPGLYLVESKSLKLYLFSFRNEGEFHEDCISIIAQDLFDLLEPDWITVKGDFYPRGGIKICPVVTLAKKTNLDS
jgi:7-cyano-7-deazaguanine reductase